MAGAFHEVPQIRDVSLDHLRRVVAQNRHPQPPTAALTTVVAVGTRLTLKVLGVLLALAAAFYHAGTWFNATQKAMPVQIGEDFVPGNVISGAHYVAWAVLSVVVLFLAGVF